MSSSSKPHFVSVAPETIAALSQLRFVTGLGNSCSQPTFDHRPSYTFGSGRKIISIESFEEGAGTLDTGVTVPPFAVLSNAVSSIQPWCSALRQPVSKSPLIAGLHVSRTASYELNIGSFSSNCSTSCADLPPYKGSISGCTIETVPS